MLYINDLKNDDFHKNYSNLLLTLSNIRKVKLFKEINLKFDWSSIILKVLAAMMPERLSKNKTNFLWQSH